MCSVHGTTIGVVGAPRARISGRSRVEFQNFARKIARNPTSNRKIAQFRLPKVRAGRKKSAQTHSNRIRRRAMHSCAFANGTEGAGRVSRGKIATKLIETFTSSAENRGF